PPTRAARQLSAKAMAAAHAVEAEPALRAQLEKTSDPSRPAARALIRQGRLITQPSRNPAVNQALATDAMPEYRSELLAAIRGIRGARLAATRDAKKPARLAEKINEEKEPAETVNDYGAAQISVDSSQAKARVMAAVSKRFPVVRVDDNFLDGDREFGYRRCSMQLRMPNGASQELQIVPKEVMAINLKEHKLYKAARNAKLAGRDASDAVQAARSQNDAAMARFASRNRDEEGGEPSERARGPALEKGSAIALPDGCRGTVCYADPNLKIVRVRMEDGRKLTVRQGQLREVPAARAKRE
ncbi:MAG TPA: hypothetical protein VGR96_01360, partial [Acidobacteriaceae bacterium]|nr:hypothetical protein [Acidobacteriaceae bacterium]